ncbi:unnamed protein product [Cylicocyclus nassatus]|uniref:Uncharacterized protein n=1 Tax=Cylicocyclus nassatus TaxID=53992 RepID=A0AA36M4U6_CYLNA|nr:unnamed protein product [Cylicocyclus nassatus]
MPKTVRQDSHNSNAVSEIVSTRLNIHLGNILAMTQQDQEEIQDDNRAPLQKLREFGCCSNGSKICQGSEKRQTKLGRRKLKEVPRRVAFKRMLCRTAAKSHIFSSDRFSFKNLQIGRFYVSTVNVSVDTRVNIIYISRSSAGIYYNIGTMKGPNRQELYTSSIMIPFDFINGIYADGHDLYIRLNSTAIYDFCLCDGELVYTDVTQGERANSLLHHLVLKARAEEFCAQLLKVNVRYFSKLIQTFPEFSKDLAGATSSQSLHRHAKAIVYENSRHVPTRITQKPFQFCRKKYPNTHCTTITLKEEAITRLQPRKASILPSGYSLPQIPDVSTIAENPVPKFTTYFPNGTRQDFPSVSYDFETAEQSPSFFALKDLRKLLPRDDDFRLQQFPQTKENHLTREESMCSLSSASTARSDTPSKLDGISPYSQSEYHSCQNELLCPLGYTEHICAPQSTSPFSYDDTTMEYYPLQDLSQTASDMSTLENIPI